jgi:hypothetical protein
LVIIKKNKVTGAKLNKSMLLTETAVSTKAKYCPKVCFQPKITLANNKVGTQIHRVIK